jgi:hypothetical protein
MYTIRNTTLGIVQGLAMNTENYVWTPATIHSGSKQSQLSFFIPGHHSPFRSKKEIEELI